MRQKRPTRRSPHAHGRSEVKTRRDLVGVVAREAVKLGKRLHQARMDRHLSQEAAAELAGLHPKALSRIENGKSNVTFASLVALALAYDLSVGELVSGDPRRR